ncbi:MAG: hypothetical protein OEV40_02545 [Acidimicrobiia bacterium]|nr:hypothetical protein [Acidimicrobiia bacterium]
MTTTAVDVDRAEPGQDTGPASDELAWLVDVLGLVENGKPTEYLGRRSVDDLRLLLPTAPPAAAAAGLLRSAADRGPARAALGRAARLVARCGGLRLAPGTRLILPPFALVEHLAAQLGEPELTAAVTIGPRRRLRKPVLQLLTPAGRVVGYAKVGWSPLTTELVTNERRMLALVEGQLGPRLEAPAVLRDLQWGDGRVVVATPLRPRRSALPRRRPGLAVPEIVSSIAAVDRRDPRPVAELSLLDEWAAGGLGEVVDLPRVLDRHGAVALSVGLWHGDLTPWNIVAGRGSAGVWDWELAGTGRPVGFDALHHEFERHRRRAGGGNGEALRRLLVDTDVEMVLSPFEAGRTPAGRDAVVDLYLCELIARELRLDGQRWTDPSVGGLALLANTALDRRLGSRR